MKSIVAAFMLIGLLASVGVVFSEPPRYSQQQATSKQVNANLVAISKGEVPKHTLVHKFGSNSAVNTTLAPVTSSATYQTPSSGQSLEIISDSAQDTITGTGAWSVTIEGLDENFAAAVHDVTMTGTSAASVPGSWTRVYRMYLKDSGTYANSSAPSHSSTITLRGSGGGVTWGLINNEAGFGLGQSEIAVYSIPANSTGYLMTVVGNVEASKSVTIVGFKRERIDETSAPFGPMRTFLIERLVSDEFSDVEGTAITSVRGPADIGFMAKTGSGTSGFSVEFSLLVVED